MEREEKNENTKDAILTTARRLFSENGFSDTSISRLAAEAGVTKSLIYYYFKDKHEILNALVDELVLANIDFKKHDLDSDGLDETHRNNFKAYYQFLDDRKDILRIVFMEALKNSDHKRDFFEILDRTIAAQKNNAKSKGKGHDEWQECLTLDDFKSLKFITFFYFMVPLAAQQCFKDQWHELYDLSQEKMLELTLDFSENIRKKVLEPLVNDYIDKIK